MPGVDPNVGKTPHVGVRGNLERQTAERLIHPGLPTHRLASLEIGALYPSDIQRARHVERHRIQQTLNPDVPTGSTA